RENCRCALRQQTVAYGCPSALQLLWEQLQPRAFGLPCHSGRRAKAGSDPACDLTGPARPPGLRGECPPAAACGDCLTLYFAPKACRPRRAADRRLAEKPGLCFGSSDQSLLIVIPAKSGSASQQPEAGQRCFALKA